MGYKCKEPSTVIGGCLFFPFTSLNKEARVWKGSSLTGSGDRRVGTLEKSVSVSESQYFFFPLSHEGLIKDHFVISRFNKFSTSLGIQTRSACCFMT